MKINSIEYSGAKNCIGRRLALFLAGAVLFGFGAQRCAAQFPSGPFSADESTFSIGVFQIQVSPNFTFLFAPLAPNTTYYPGFSPTSDILTSPVMFDDATIIGTSALDTFPGHFSPPQTIGSTGVGGFGVSANNPGNQITGMSAYVAVPFSFEFSTAGFDQIYTEIEAFDLSCPPMSCGTDERVPPSLLNNNQVTLVTAGPLSQNGFSPGNPNNLPLRSIGMVQQTGGAGTVAQSFFNINVTVRLPAVTQTASINDFPVSGFAVLTNNPAHPLLIINTNVPSLPPPVVYIHGLTPAVPLYFRDNNPPYWSAGDLFGYITLAGHGVFGCTNNSGNGTSGGDSNCCASVTDSGFVNTMLDETLGPVGLPKAGMATPWKYASDIFPPTNTAFGSLMNTVVDPLTGATNDLSATVNFMFGPVLVSVRNFQVGAYSNSIVPPAAPGSIAIFNATNVPVSFEISNSGSWYPAAGIGSLSMVVSNTGLSSATLYYPGSLQQTYYTLQLTAFDSQCEWQGGPIEVRQNPGLPSFGDLTFAQAGDGYTLASQLNVNLQATTDGVDFFDAVNSIQLVPNVPPAVPGTLFVSQQNTNILLQWQNNFTLQSTTNLLVPFTDEPGPVTNGYYAVPVHPAPAPAKFYRLVFRP